MEKKCYVYVLQSELTGRIYIGQTSELAKRIAQHNDPTNKLTKYTKINKGPWRLIYHETWNSRAKAKMREDALKSGQGRQWLKEKILMSVVQKESSMVE